MKTIRKFLFLIILALPAFSVHAEWYEGGTLHEANGIEWQQASFENKLATVGDFVASLYSEKKFSPDVQAAIDEGGMPAIKLLSAAIVAQLDDAFEPDPDPSENKRLFSNQTVPFTALLVMNLMGLMQSN